MRLLVAIAVSLAAGLFVAVADDRADKLEALKKKFDAEYAELRQRYQNATPEEARGIQTELKELAVITAQKAVAIAEDDPKGTTGFEAAAFVIEKTGRFGGKELDAAVAIVSEHHADNPKLKALLPALTAAGPAGEKLLKAVAEKGTDKEAKAVALFVLGAALAARLDAEEDAKAADALVAKATEYLEKAAKEAPDAKVRTSTVAKEVAAQLAVLKAATSVAVGKAVPEIEGTDLAGKKVKLSGYKGKVVLLDIWATWCGPCRAMIPHERDLVKGMTGKPFALLSVSCDDQQEALTKFLEKEPMPWDHWFDGRGGTVAKTFRVRAFPTLYLIDHSGVIRHKWVGSPGNEALDTAVEELVKEAVKAKG